MFCFLLFSFALKKKKNKTNSLPSIFWNRHPSQLDLFFWKEFHWSCSWGVHVFQSNSAGKGKTLCRSVAECLNHSCLLFFQQVTHWMIEVKIQDVKITSYGNWIQFQWVGKVDHRLCIVRGASKGCKPCQPTFSSELTNFFSLFFYLFSSSSWIALAVILEIGDMECKSRWGTWFCEFQVLTMTERNCFLAFQ